MSLFHPCCPGSCVLLGICAQCLFVSTRWPAAAPSGRPAGGERAEDFRVPQPGRARSRAVEVRLCFQEDALDTRAPSWLADTSSSSLPCHRLVRAPALNSFLPSITHAGMSVHICTVLTPRSHGIIKVGKDIQYHQVCPTNLCIFLPTFSVSCRFLLVSLSLEGCWTERIVITHAVVKLRNLSLGWILFVLVVNQAWWMDKQLPQSLQSV